MKEDEYVSAFLDDAITIIKKIDRIQIQKMSRFFRTSVIMVDDCSSLVLEGELVTHLMR